MDTERPLTSFKRRGTGEVRLSGRQAAVQSRLGSIASERSRDHGHVVIDHADIGALVGAWATHRIGKELATDLDRVAARRRTLDQRADVAFGDRGLDEDGADLAVDEELHDVLDLPEARLAFGRD